jgi:hypothetical protein
LARYYLWLTRPPPTFLYNPQTPFFPPFRHPRPADSSWGCRQHVPLEHTSTTWHVHAEDHWLNTQVPMFCSCIPQHSLPWRRTWHAPMKPMYKGTRRNTPEDRTLPSSWIPLLATSYSVALTNSYGREVSSDISGDVNYEIWCLTQNVLDFQRQSMPNSTKN